MWEKLIGVRENVGKWVGMGEGVGKTGLERERNGIKKKPDWEKMWGKMGLE